MADEPKDVRLTEADRAMGALHDVSNALTLLLGWVAEARGAAGEEQRGHALAMIEQRAMVARDLARRAIGAKSSSIEHEESLRAVFTDVLEALAVEGQRAQVRLVSTVATSARVGRAGDLSHILTNLTMNALAYAPPGSDVLLTAESNGVSVIVHVQDAGPGIDPARAASVFAGDSTREGGAGVGLWHARSVARAAGGELELVPRGAVDHPGKGARFRLVWPRADLQYPPSPMSSARIKVLAGTRILILEDDPDVASLLETALGARGATVTIARSKIELDGASAAKHDAALLDLSPIAQDVEGAVERLRAGSPAVRLVFISGSAAGMPESLAHVRWVRKPFEIAEVVAALTEAALVRK